MKNRESSGPPRQPTHAASSRRCPDS